jgi:DNA-binding MarR family transcriptional regulator
MPKDYALQILALLYKYNGNVRYLYRALVPKGYEKIAIRVNLVRLQKKGLVEKIKERKPHCYRLTDKGKRLFESRLKTLESLLDFDFGIKTIKKGNIDKL